MREISLQMAQDMGLVPRPSQFDTRWKFGPLVRIKLCGEYEYRKRRRAIVEQFCINKELEICDYDSLVGNRAGSGEGKGL